ncbi:MAG TPA: hypothetical protein VJU78_16480 [Chitinophagaceae bacterium]|nr:hypothetical protein [Chitinophagaceae bacterium]
MEEINVTNEMKVEINYSYEYLPTSVKNLHPLLFRNGKSYRCALGPDQQLSIVGYGETPEAALYTWDKQWQEQNLKVSVVKIG